MRLWSPGLFLLLAGLSLSLPAAGRRGIQEVQALVGDTVKLSCIHPLGPGVTLGDLYLYWQADVGGRTIAVASHLGLGGLGAPDLIFQNRTRLSAEGMKRGDFSLHLSDVGPQDQLTFQCLLLRKSQNMQPLFNVSVDLKVAAHFSPPVVTSEDGPEDGELTFTCTSSDGFPKPRLHWVNRTDGSLLPGALTNCSRDSRGLYHVHSVLRLPRTPSIRVGCCVENLSLQQNLSSPPEPVLSPSPSGSPSGQSSALQGSGGTVFSVLAVLVVLVAVAAGWACRSQCPPRRRYTGAQEERPVQELTAPQLHPPSLLRPRLTKSAPCTAHGQTLGSLGFERDSWSL
ncbi:ICOS ligand isoform X3 [Erinaceus europaeus]|uniref:ICOS ligand isoform X3 n=1 Tax=Erinaceus europaeus TaxID=9365 RepID=A0ABM3Y141_ERIEU|nr:ICOS ligand isoform X3 [Erinaceus europaeus]